MKNKQILIILGVVLISVFGTGIITISSFTENNTQNISKTKISDVIPGATVGGGSYSIVTTNIADIAYDVVYTIEGTILEFGEPILHAGSQNRAHGAIPVTMSVDKLYKGTLDSETFTFYLDSDVWLYPGEYVEGDEFFPNNLDNHRNMYFGTDYTDVPKSYNIRYHYELFEIGDKIIAHFEIAQLPPPRYIYEKDHGTIDEIYVLALAAFGYYDVKDNGMIYGGEHHNTIVPLNRALTESLLP